MKQHLKWAALPLILIFTIAAVEPGLKIWQYPNRPVPSDTAFFVLSEGGVTYNVSAFQLRSKMTQGLATVSYVNSVTSAPSSGGDTVWTNESGVIRTLGGTVVFTTNQQNWDKFIAKGAFITESRARTLSLGTNVLPVLTNAFLLLDSPTNNPTNVVVEIGPAASSGQLLFILNNQTNKSYIIYDGSVSGLGFVDLQGDFISTNYGRGLILQNNGNNWIEMGRVNPSITDLAALALSSNEVSIATAVSNITFWFKSVSGLGFTNRNGLVDAVFDTLSAGAVTNVSAQFSNGVFITISNLIASATNTVTTNLTARLMIVSNYLYTNFTSIASGGPTIWQVSTNLDVDGGPIVSTVSTNPLYPQLVWFAGNHHTNFFPETSLVLSMQGGPFNVATMASNNAAVAGIGHHNFDSATTISNIDFMALGNYNYLSAQSTGNVHVLALGDSNFWGTEMDGNTAVYGFGTGAFKDAFMIQSSKIFAYGYRPFIQSIIDTSVNLYAVGDQIGFNATFENVHDLFAFGNGALTGADLLNSSDIYVFGRDAGSGLVGSYTNVMLFGIHSVLPGTKDYAVFGTNMPLHVQNQLILDGTATIKMTNGASAGKVLTSDANGVGTWGAGSSSTNFSLIVSTNYLEHRAVLAYSSVTNVIVDIQSANAFLLTLTNNVLLIFTNWPPDPLTKTINIDIVQDSTGGRQVFFDSHIKFTYGGVPIITTNANAWDVLTSRVGPTQTNFATAVAPFFQ